MNLCTGKSYTNEEVVTQIGEALHCEIRVVKGGYPEHSWDIQNWVGSNQHASERLGWRPRHSLSEGLALTWQWMQRHPATYGIGAES
jgi:UDP-glucose 4-epimerase